MRLIAFTAQETQVSDLTPLRGMPLKWLDLYRAPKVTDVSPLKGLPLEYLNLTGVPLSEVSLVADLKSLWRLILEEMPVADLTPLRDLDIIDLNIMGTRVTDLTPIKGLPLKRLGFDYRPDRAEFLRSFAGLEVVNDKPVAEFRVDVEKK